VGKVVLSQIPLGCGHDNEGYFIGAAGLLGLGKGPLAFPNHVDPQMGGRFSYCLTDRETDSSEGSSLIFGDAAVPSTGARSVIFLIIMLFQISKLTTAKPSTYDILNVYSNLVYVVRLAHPQRFW